MLSSSVASDSATPWTVGHQGPLSIGYSRQVYWDGLPFPTPGHLHDPGIKLSSLASLASLAWAGGLPLHHLGLQERIGKTKLLYGLE